MEQERVRNLLPMYDAIPTGKFAAHMMRQALAKAEAAAAALLLLTARTA